MYRMIFSNPSLQSAIRRLHYFMLTAFHIHQSHTAVGGVMLWNYFNLCQKIPAYFSECNLMSSMGRGGGGCNIPCDFILRETDQKQSQ